MAASEYASELFRENGAWIEWAPEVQKFRIGTPDGQTYYRRDRPRAVEFAKTLPGRPVEPTPEPARISRAPGTTVRDEEYVPVGPSPEMRRDFFETYRPPAPERPWAETYWEKTMARQREAFNAVYGRQMRRGRR